VARGNKRCCEIHGRILPIVAGKDAILVVCDQLSKMTHFVATTKGTSAEGLARLFRNNMWKLHRLPESVVSDREL